MGIRLERRDGRRCSHLRMRCLIAVALLTSMVASAAQAKLNPTFSERVAETGDLVAIDVGEGSQHFLGPLRIYLVPLHAADQLKGEADPRLLKIGELGTAGEFRSEERRVGKECRSRW